MTDQLTNDTLKQTLGMAVSVIATEHFMSAGLSSPWSVAKFAISDEDKQQVWHYFYEAAGASVIFSVITSFMLKSWYPIFSSGLTLIYYRKLYSDALTRTPTQNPTNVLSNPASHNQLSNPSSYPSYPLGQFHPLMRLRQHEVGKYFGML